MDLVITGGGLSGLSLAVALAGLGEACPRTHIVEARPDYIRDRTWSYWRLHGHAFDSVARTRWSRCLVRGGGRAVHFDAGDTPYETIDAHDVYNDVLARLKDHPRISLSLGTPVNSVQDGSDGVTVETPAGSVRARMCIDTRPPAWNRNTKGPALVQGLNQAFAGIEIETDRPCFDPDEVILMDFLDPTHLGEMRFFYVLPYSPTRALVEDTRFTPLADAPPPLEGLEEAVARYVGAPFTIHYQEAACLPMVSDVGMEPAARGSRIVKIGGASGALRPSTGYGFLAIQRQVEALADAVGRHGLQTEALRAVVSTRPAWLSAMDRVWLRVLRHHPDMGPLLSALIFEKASTPRAIRFLADTGTLVDAASVVLALPKAPFLMTAASLLLGLKEFGPRGAAPVAAETKDPVDGMPA
ncbi:MAG: lycopene cyclase family protein [Alphaproteobacteria bacterium]